MNIFIKLSASNKMFNKHLSESYLIHEYMNTSLKPKTSKVFYWLCPFRLNILGIMNYDLLLASNHFISVDK